MTAQWVPSTPPPFYQTADMEPHLDGDDFIDVVEEPRIKPKKSNPFEPSFEMWKLRKAGITSDQKTSWKTASKDKSPFASDAVAKKLQKLLKQKNSGVQTYQGLSSVKQLLVDFLVNDKNAAENHPYAEWTCEHIDTSDEKSKVDEKRAIYAFLQRRDTRRSPTLKKESKSSQRPDNIIDISDRLRRTTLEDSSSSSKPAKTPKAPKLHVNVDKDAGPRAKGWGQYDYVQVPQVQDASSAQPVSSPSGQLFPVPPGWRQHDYFQVPQAQGHPSSTQPAQHAQPSQYAQPEQSTQPLSTPFTQPVPTPSGQSFPSPAGWVYPPYAHFPRESNANAAEPWRYDHRPSPAGLQPDDTCIHARMPFETQEPGNPFSQGYFTQGQNINPKQIRTEAPRPVETDGIPSMRGGAKPVNEIPRHEPVSPPINPWHDRFDHEPKWDPNRPLDWAEKERQRMGHSYPPTDVSDEVWSNATSGKQSTAPTSVSQGSYGRASFEDFSPPTQHDHRSAQGSRYYHPASGSSGYHRDGKPAVQEPAKTQHQQSQRPDARYYEQRRDRRAASPRVHQKYSPRSPSHSPPRHKDDHRRGRSPSFPPEWRYGDYHERERPRRDYSPIPMDRAERRSDKRHQGGPESREHSRDRRQHGDPASSHEHSKQSGRYERRPAYEQSPSPPWRVRAERDYDPRSKRDYDPRTERDYDHRPQGDRSPDYSSQGTRKAEAPSHPAEMMEKLARAIRRTEEDDERKRQEEKEKELYAKVREEVLADMYSQRGAPGPNNPGPSAGFRQ